MSVSRIAVLLIALLCAGGAAFLLGGGFRAKPQAEAAMPAPDMAEVLVSSRTLEVGSVVQPGDLVWQKWPKVAVAGHFITKEDRPSADTDLAGTVARAVVFSGEPATEMKLVRADSASFMAASLSPGMRAISVPLTAESGAGGFILPNDRVDVIASVSRSDEGMGGTQRHFSQTILQNIRVLAVGDTMRDTPTGDAETDESSSSSTHIEAKTATLEVTPAEAELIQLAASEGVVSLTLRGITEADASTGAPRVPMASGEARPVNQPINIIRYGQRVQVNPGAAGN